MTSPEARADMVRPAPHQGVGDCVDDQREQQGEAGQRGVEADDLAVVDQ